MTRKLLLILGGIVVVLFLAILALPLFVNVNQYRPQIDSLLTQALNRKVDIGNIQLSLFSGGVSVNDLAVADDPAFSSGAFLKAKSVTVGVEMMPLIFSRSLRVTGITIEQPEAVLLRSPSGTWNFSTLGARPGGAAPTSGTPEAGSAAPAGGSSAAANLFIQRLDLKDGTVFVGDAGSNAKTHSYDHVNVGVSNLSYTTEFPFDLTLATPGNGTVELKGKAGPLNQGNMQATPVDASLTVKNLDLTVAGFADAASGLAGLVDFDGTLTSDGKQVSTKGKVTATKLQLVPGASPASEPVEIDYETEYQLGPRSGTLKQGDVHIGKATAHLAGTYQTTGETTALQMKLDGDSMPVTDIASLLPAIGVTLPAGASLKDGTLNLTLTTGGPLDKLVTTGPINVSNAKLSGFDLGSKMKALSTFAGIPSGSDTTIQTLSSTVRVATDGIRMDNFNLVVPSIGNLTGGGTISSDHKLDFKMAVKLSNAASPLGAISSLASLSGGGKNGNGGGIPFLIQGTTSNPTFLPDLKGLASGITGSAANGGKALAPAGKDLGGALGELFGKKK